jgi:hypothetical protein
MEMLQHPVKADNALQLPTRTELARTASTARQLEPFAFRLKHSACSNRKEIEKLAMLQFCVNGEETL